MNDDSMQIVIMAAGLLVGIAGVATLFFRKRLAANLAKLPPHYAAQTRGASYPIFLGITQMLLGVALVTAGMSSDTTKAALSGLFASVGALPLMPGILIVSVLLLVGAVCISLAVPPLRRARARLEVEASGRDAPDSAPRFRNAVTYASVSLILGLVAIGWAFIVGMALILAGPA